MTKIEAGTSAVFRSVGPTAVLKLSSLAVPFAMLAGSCGAGEEGGNLAASSGPSLNDSAPIVMPVTFPDGSSANVAYSEDLPLGRFVITAWTSGRLPGCCARIVRIRRAEDGVTRQEFGVSGQPVSTFEGADGGEVNLWRAPPGSATRYNLVFLFGVWMAAVASDNGGEQMNDAQLATWARSLHGRVARAGFVVLYGEDPLDLAAVGDREGPQMTFDHGLPRQPRFISLSPADTNGTPSKQEVSHGFLSWDAPGDRMHFQAQGDEVFLQDLPKRLRVTNVKLLRR